MVVVAPFAIFIQVVVGEHQLSHGVLLRLKVTHATPLFYSGIQLERAQRFYSSKVGGSTLF